jgi:hypothetical protein
MAIGIDPALAGIGNARAVGREGRRPFVVRAGVSSVSFFEAMSNRYRCERLSVR